jgi:hypothetical protein
MQDLTISLGFIDRVAQNQQYLAIFRLEFLVKPRQLAGMTPALNSVKFPYKEENDIAF